MIQIRYKSRLDQIGYPQIPNWALYQTKREKNGSHSFVYKNIRLWIKHGSTKHIYIYVTNQIYIYNS